MPQTSQNNFQNFSGPNLGKRNLGVKGKFNDQQIEERTRVHAIAIATGTPTYVDIVALWAEKFGIQIAVVSEKEWRATNRNRIEKKKHELIETGEIAIPVVSEEVLADSMMGLTIATSVTVRDIRSKARKFLQQIKTRNDLTPEEKETNKDNLRFFTTLVNCMHKLNGSVTNQLESMFAFSSKIKIKDKKLAQLVDERFNERIQEFQEDNEIDEETEITDEDRAKLLKEVDGDSEDQS